MLHLKCKNQKERIKAQTSEADEGDRAEGWLLFHETHKGHIFVKGVFVCRMKRLKYGVDIVKGLDVGRDRNVVDNDLLCALACRLWGAAAADSREGRRAAVSLFDMLEEEPPSQEVAEAEDFLSDAACRAMSVEFSLRFGEDAIAVGSGSREDEQTGHTHLLKLLPEGRQNQKKCSKLLMEVLARASRPTLREVVEKWSKGLMAFPDMPPNSPVRASLKGSLVEVRAKRFELGVLRLKDSTPGSMLAYSEDGVLHISKEFCEEEKGRQFEIIMDLSRFRCASRKQDFEKCMFRAYLDAEKSPYFESDKVTNDGVNKASEPSDEDDGGNGNDGDGNADDSGNDRADNDEEKKSAWYMLC